MKKTTEMTANILRIEKISIADGEGMRTVIFFKGCPLHCAWCSTPESQKSVPEAYYCREKCRFCGACVQACPRGALKISREDGSVVRDASLCTNCLVCADACLYKAMRVWGREMTVSQVVREIEKDAVFYYHSGGGVTLSGGSVLVWAEFAEQLLGECRDMAIDTSAELELYGSREDVGRVVPLLDQFFVDLKVMDPEKHRHWTGTDNALIHENLRYADSICDPGAIHIRVPLIPGINDDPENLLAAARFAAELENCSELEILPYHRLGLQSYRRMGREYELASLPVMTNDEAAEKISCLRHETWPFTLRVAGKKIGRAAVSH